MTHRRRRHRHHRGRPARCARRPRRARRDRRRCPASLSFGWRAMLKIKHVPLQLFDVTVFPIMFVLLYTYLFGGALAGSPREYLQELLPGILVMNVTWITMYTGQGLKMDIDKGVFDRFRSLPIWRPAVLVGMLLADAVRYTIACARDARRSGIALGFRPDGGVARRARRGRPAARVRVLPVVGLDDARRSTSPTPESVMQMRHDRAVPADVRQQRVRRPGDDAGLGAGVRRRSTRSATWRRRHAA